MKDIKFTGRVLKQGKERLIRIPNDRLKDFEHRQLVVVKKINEGDL